MDALPISPKSACLIILLSGIVTASSNSSAETQSPTQQTGLTAEVAAVATAPDMASRYGVLSTFPKGTYQPWHMTAGSVVNRTVAKVPDDKDKKIVEILVYVSNNGARTQTFRFENVGIAIPGHDTVAPFEFLFAGVVGDHDELSQALSLGKKAEDKSMMIKLSIEGGLSCDLKPKEKTWMALVFLVPRDSKDAALRLGKMPPIAVTLAER